MPSYRLNINFSGSDLDTIYKAGERVVVVKHTEERNSLIAWVSFKPFERNTIDWETQFALYAASGEIQSGAVINKLSDCMGQCRVNSIFENGYFSKTEPDDSIGLNSYEVTNHDGDKKILTFGLAQGVNVNGIAFPNNPINAVLVPRGHHAVMTPTERIDVFLEARAENSTVLSRIDSKSVSLTYSGDVRDISLNYDPKNGAFYTA
jgi:hypothetical protein